MLHLDISLLHELLTEFGRLCFESDLFDLVRKPSLVVALGTVLAYDVEVVVQITEERVPVQTAETRLQQVHSLSRFVDLDSLQHKAVHQVLHVVGCDHEVFVVPPVHVLR